MDATGSSEDSQATKTTMIVLDLNFYTKRFSIVQEENQKSYRR
jgi:hypothetical protein